MTFPREVTGAECFRSHGVALRWLSAGLVCLVQAACTGSLTPSTGEDRGGRDQEGDWEVPSDDPSGPGPDLDEEAAVFAEAATPPACLDGMVSRDIPLRRLSRRQFVNNVRAAVQHLLPAAVDEVLASASAELESIPTDALVPPPSFGATGFGRSDQTLSQRLADTHFELATALGKAITSTPTHLVNIFGACAGDASRDNDVACASTALGRWGARLLRRPLSGDEIAFLAQAAAPSRGGAASREGFADLITLIFAQPSFLFHVEGGDSAPDKPAATLDAFELASRLSFQLRDEPPDDLLWQAAQADSLREDSVFEMHVQRLLDGEAAARVRDQFFDEWLGLSQGTPDLLARVATSKAWANFTVSARPPESSRKAMIDDVLAMTRAEVAANNPVANLLSSRRVYAKDPWLAGLYQVSGGNNDSALAPEPGSAAHVGLITRPAFTASGSTDTRPIHKGARIRNQLLCGSIPAPPAGAANALPPFDPENPQTTRALAELLTEQDGTACKGCHESLINPLGFATENFDGLGRERQHEAVFGEDGQHISDLPLHTATALAADAGELTHMMLDSGAFAACFARQLFRFSTSRPVEDDEADGCRLRALVTAAQQGVGLRDVMAAFVLAPEFRRRVFH